MQNVVAVPDASIGNSIVALGIGETEPNQRHICIVHRGTDVVHRFLHLAWHCLLRNEVDRPEYITHLITLSFHPDRLLNLAAFCRRVWKKNSQGGIPYAFSNSENAFDLSSGAFIVGPTRFGLTCATFVIAVFDRVGLHLVDVSSWEKERPGDREWQEQIVEKLKDRADQSHILHIQSEVGAARFRPEEVAAAGTVAPPAARLEHIESIGKEIAILCSKAKEPPQSKSS